MISYNIYIPEHLKCLGLYQIRYQTCVILIYRMLCMYHKCMYIVCKVNSIWQDPNLGTRCIEIWICTGKTILPVLILELLLFMMSTTPIHMRHNISTDSSITPLSTWDSSMYLGYKNRISWENNKMRLISKHVTCKQKRGEIMYVKCFKNPLPINQSIQRPIEFSQRRISTWYKQTQNSVREG